ncbi:hypothetical protein ANN_15898 [Periplaneta americana]|uniref:Uncharacterized protein n=1 Tax=Periplaneta americana TaxID=6978 RepID=A0ABQ8SHH0_PERAM|nr:hypothetical protein ANN_15898 [Periplaneta americana]
MCSGSSVESYPAFALNGLMENPEKNLKQDRIPVSIVIHYLVPTIDTATQHPVPTESTTALIFHDRSSVLPRVPQLPEIDVISMRVTVLHPATSCTDLKIAILNVTEKLRIRDFSTSTGFWKSRENPSPFTPFSTAVGLKPDGLRRVLGINPFDLITWLGFSEFFCVVIPVQLYIQIFIKMSMRGNSMVATSPRNKVLVNILSSVPERTGDRVVPSGSYIYYVTWKCKQSRIASNLCYSYWNLTLNRSCVPLRAVRSIPELLFVTAPECLAIEIGDVNTQTRELNTTSGEVEITLDFVADRGNGLSVAKRVEQQVNIRRFNIPKLKDEETKQHYQVEISNRYTALGSSDEVEEEFDVNSMWENIRDNNKIAAEQSIGYYETMKKKPWFDED